MAIDNYKPTLWEDSIMQNFHDASFVGLITTPPTEVNGEKIVFNRLSPGSWKDYISGQKIEWSEVATTKVEMTFPKQKYYAFMVDDCDQAQLKGDVLNSVTKEETDLLDELISQEVVSFIISNTPAANTIGATPGTLTGTATIETATSTENGKNLVLKVNGNAAITITLATGDTLASIITKINTAAGSNIASDSSGKLALTSTTVGTNSTITIDASSDAAVLTFLGFTGGATNSGAISQELITKSNAYDTIVDLNTIANKAKVPTTGRYCIINPDYLAMLAKDDRFTRQYTILQNGVVDGATINGSTIICKADNPIDKIVLAHASGTGFAMQLKGDPEAVRLQDYFSDGVRGVCRYGYTQLRSESSCVEYIKFE
jgi:hypothetical protein